MTDRVMPKYYKKRYYRVNKDKYSVEQSAFTTSVTASNQQATLIVPPVATQGMRKVKHLIVDLAATGATASNVDMFWALVYVPQGTTPNTITVASTAGSSAPMYEPNQFVMACGVMDFSAGPTRIRTPLSRNLNSGDAIYLILANPGGVTNTIYGTVRYAITLQ